MTVTPSATESLVVMRVGTQRFCIAARMVLEVTRMVAFSAPAAEGAAIQGIITYRGEVIPMVALHALVHQPWPTDLPNCGLVVATPPFAVSAPVALLVDEVEAVIDVPIAATASPMGQRGALSEVLSFVSDVMTLDRQVMFRLDLDRVMAVVAALPA